ncbi:MAG: hypothetical protein CMF39_05190 [Legionellaceae bacterium]|nr:hypothetical protein [Legionellaceae bacterium]|tara:strand:- start:1307 stop:1699 length:393 start_codon:yes stop_codon:yes gene_type:complete
MIAIDTNVLVRFLVDDSPSQTKKALDLVVNHSVFIPKTVFLETEWVLRYAYEFTKKQIMLAFRKITNMKNVVLEDAACVKKALDWCENENLDFADALHLSSSLSAKSFVTFDKTFVKKSRAIKNVTARLL